MLDDDGHLFGKAILQIIGHLHALGARAERDVEVMIAGQVLQLRHLLQRSTHYAFQRGLGQRLIANKVCAGAR